jgi:hypothetical protein
MLLLLLLLLLHQQRLDPPLSNANANEKDWKPYGSASKN